MLAKFASACCTDSRAFPSQPKAPCMRCSIATDWRSVTVGCGVVRRYSVVSGAAAQRALVPRLQRRVPAAKSPYCYPLTITGPIVRNELHGCTSTVWCWPRRTFQVENRRKLTRCQATTVSGLTMAPLSASRARGVTANPQEAIPGGEFRSFCGPLEPTALVAQSRILGPHGPISKDHLQIISNFIKLVKQ